MLKRLEDNLSQLVDPNIAKNNLPKKEGHEYGWAVFATLPNINISSNKCPPVSPVTVTCVDVKYDSDDVIVDHVKGFMINVPLVQWVITNSCSIN